MKILVVEDDPVARAVEVAIIASLGHEVIVTAGGDEGWAQLQANQVRVVVSDWRMQHGDGLGLCRRLRNREGDYVYFILLTQVEPTEENEQQAIEAGVDDFLAKPVLVRELRQRLHVAERILRYTRQLKQLQQFLPICGYCKKVRDDHDYWLQLERYLAENTGTRFSHGICPECYRKHVIPQLEPFGG